MSTKPITVLWVDDSPDAANLYCRLVSMEPDMACVGTLTSADALVDEAGRLQPGVVVLDLTMPGRDPVDALAELTRTHPEIRTVVFSGYDDLATADRVATAGAWGLVSKHDEPTSVVRAIRNVANGQMCFPGMHRHQ